MKNRLRNFTLMLLGIFLLSISGAMADQPPPSYYNTTYSCSSANSYFQLSDIPTRLIIQDGCDSPDIETTGEVYLYWNKSESSPNAFYPKFANGTDPNFYFFNFENIFLSPLISDNSYLFSFIGTDQLNAFDLTGIKQDITIKYLNTKYENFFSEVKNIDIAVDSNTSTEIEVKGENQTSTVTGNNDPYITLVDNNNNGYTRNMDKNSNTILNDNVAKFGTEYCDFDGDGIRGVPYTTTSSGADDKLKIWEEATNSSYYIGIQSTQAVGNTSTCGDVDGDGGDEYVYKNLSDKRLYSFDGENITKIPSSYNIELFGGIGDIDGDKYSEVIVFNDDKQGDTFFIDISGDVTDSNLAYGSFFYGGNLGEMSDLDGDGYEDEFLYHASSNIGVYDHSTDTKDEVYYGDLGNWNSWNHVGGIVDTNIDGKKEVCAIVQNSTTTNVKCIPYDINNGFDTSNIITYSKVGTTFNNLGVGGEIATANTTSSSSSTIDFILGENNAVEDSVLKVYNGDPTTSDLRLYSVNMENSLVNFEGDYVYGNSFIDKKVTENTFNVSRLLIDEPLATSYYANTLIYDNSYATLTSNYTSYGVVGGVNISNEHLYKNGSNKFICPSTTTKVSIGVSDYNVCQNKTAVFQSGSNTTYEYVITEATRRDYTPPEQIASFTPITHGFNEDSILDMNNYFNNFDDIKVYFKDKEANRSVILDGTKGDARDDVYSNDYSITVTSLADKINLKFDSDFSNLDLTNITIEACNSNECVNDTFTYEIDRDLHGGTTAEDFYRGWNSYLKLNMSNLLSSGEYYQYHANIVRETNTLFELDSRTSTSTLPSYKELSYFDVNAENDIIEFYTKEKNTQIFLAVEVYNSTDNVTDTALYSFTVEDGLPYNPYPDNSSPSGYTPSEDTNETTTNETDIDYLSKLEPKDEDKPFWSLLIIIGVTGLVAFASVNGGGSFLASSVFGVISMLATIFVLSYMGWLPSWIVVLIITGLAAWLSKFVYGYYSGG